MSKQQAALQWAAVIVGGLFPIIALAADIAVPSWSLEWNHILMYGIGVLPFVAMAFNKKVPEILDKLTQKRPE